MHALVAYIDPGSGTLLVQAAIAAVCGGVLLCRHAAWRLLTLFVRREKNVPPSVGATALSAVRHGACIPSTSQNSKQPAAGHADRIA